MKIKSTCTFLGRTAGAVFLSAALLAQPAFAESNEELAKQLANPVASLISLPFQFNYDSDIGLNDDGERITVNIQPVIPFELSERWNLISRTIVPVIHQEDIFPGAGDQTGLGDTVQSLFFSPVPGANGLIWGVGPVFLLPTATDDLLGTEKWGAGPTAVALMQTGGWTFGVLANHIESFAGTDTRADISSTFVNPFLSRQMPGGWTLGTQLEHTFDHENDMDTGVFSCFLSKVTRIGNQTVSVGITPKYWYEDTPSSPEGFGIRATITFLFPK